MCISMKERIKGYGLSDEGKQLIDRANFAPMLDGAPQSVDWAGASGLLFVLARDR